MKKLRAVFAAAAGISVALVLLLAASNGAQFYGQFFSQSTSVMYTTNAFPLSPGTVWDWSRYGQFISTGADFNVTAIAGLAADRENQAQLQISNNSAGQIICHLTFAMNKIGPLTTNDIYLASHKQAYVNGDARGIGTATNIVTLTEP